MAEKEEVIKEKVDYTGVFNFSEFYSFTYGWLKDEGYDVAEEKYSEKVTGNAREINVEWKAARDLSDYFKVEIKAEFKIQDLVDVELEIDGKKKRMNKGKVGVELKGTLIRDPEHKWEGSSFNRFLRGVYDKYIIPKRIEGMEDRIISSVSDFKEEMKAFLELLGKR